MSDSTNSANDWECVIAELEAYRESQQEIWGDLDDMTVARYLAGACSDEEQKTVTEMMKAYPAVDELIGVLREVLALPATAAREAPAESAPAEAGLCWQVGQEAINLVDHLAAWVDRQGQLLAAGLQSCLLDMQPAFGQSLGTPDAVTEEVRLATWEIPIASPPSRLTISVQPGESSDDWKLSCRLQCPSVPDLPARCRVEIRSMQGELEDGGSLVELAKQPVSLGSGTWQILVFAERQVWRIRLDVGKPPGED